MSESYVQVTEGVGKKLHSFQRTIGSNDVQDEIVVLGEPYLPSYTATASGQSMTTINSTLLQLMAGSSLKLYVHRIAVYQSADAGTATVSEIQIARITSAGSGGTVITPNPHDSGDAASGASAMALPSSAPTVTTSIVRRPFIARDALPASAELPIFHWEPARGSKAIVVPVSNGIAVRLVGSALTSATCNVEIDFTEASF